MTTDQAYAMLAQMIHELAPEIDLDDVDTDADMASELDLDSISRLNLVEMIHERAAIDVPEADYAQLSSIDATVAYLVSHGG